LPLLLLCASVGGACSGNSLEDFSRRELRVQVLPLIGTREQVRFQAELVRIEAEAGCLRLESGVTATLDGAPLSVYEGSQTPDADGPCGSPVPVPPTFSLILDAARFTGAQGHAVLEIRDGDQRILAEFPHFYAPHGIARTDPPQTVRPGQEVVLAWDPPTDDLSIVEEVGLFGAGLTKPDGSATTVAARPEAGGLRVTMPATLPSGSIGVVARSAYIPPTRCEGVARCTALVLPPPPTELRVAP
jgi:hypothetical protein